MLGLALLARCAEEEEQGATATATPTAAVVTTPGVTPSPEATPVATGRATPAVTATPTSPTAGLGKLAFVRDGDIWVLDVDSGRERQLTTDGQNWWPQWSADGEWIAFQKRVRQGEVQTLTEVWTMRADGSAAAKRADSSRSNIEWSPAGARLAYSSEDGAVWAVDADGGNRAQVLPPGDEIYRVAWSPDGKQLAVERWIQGKQLTPPPNTTVAQGIWLLNADGSGLSKLYGPFQRSQLGPVAYLSGWSPDGKRITFWQGSISASLMADGAPLLVLPVEGGQAQEIASFTLLKRGFVAWSSQGDRLAVVEGGGRETWLNKQIVVMQPDGSDRRLLSDASRADLFPAWSPDGQRIAFTSGQSSEPDTAYENPPEMLRTRRVWVVNSDGSEKRQLTSDPAYADQFPQWSADGAHIMFVRQQAEAIGREGEESTPVEIWLMTADGSEQRKVVDGLSSGWFGYYGFVDWSQLLDWHR